jgi:hypothetical protein
MTRKITAKIRYSSSLKLKMEEVVSGFGLGVDRFIIGEPEIVTCTTERKDIKKAVKDLEKSLSEALEKNGGKLDSFELVSVDKVP